MEVGLGGKILVVVSQGLGRGEGFIDLVVFET